MARVGRNAERHLSHRSFFAPTILPLHEGHRDVWPVRVAQHTWSVGRGVDVANGPEPEQGHRVLRVLVRVFGTDALDKIRPGGREGVS
jgi:hypothetical protein